MYEVIIDNKVVYHGESYKDAFFTAFKLLTFCRIVTFTKNGKPLHHTLNYHFPKIPQYA